MRFIESCILAIYVESTNAQDKRENYRKRHNLARRQCNVDTQEYIYTEETTYYILCLRMFVVCA